MEVMSNLRTLQFDILSTRMTYLCLRSLVASWVKVRLRHKREIFRLTSCSSQFSGKIGNVYSADFDVSIVAGIFRSE